MSLKELHYGWVMVILAMFALFVHAMINSVFGIFLRPLTIEFGWDRGALSAAVSIFALLGGSVGILSGRLCDRYGPRPLVTAGGILAGVAFLLMAQINFLWQVYLVWGLLMGIAFSSVMISITSTIPRWFTVRRGIAQGCTMAGGGLGMTIWPTFTQWLISFYDWRQAYLILGLIYLLITIPAAQFMKHSPQRIGQNPYGENETIGKDIPASIEAGLSLKQIIKTGRFWILGLTLFCFLFGGQVILVHIVPHAIDTGIASLVAAGIMSTIAIVSIIGRFSVGFLSDRVGTRMVLTSCLFLLILALTWLLFTKDVWMFYAFAAVFGIVMGFFTPIIPLVAAELFGLKFLGTILATVMFLGTMGGAIGVPLAGIIFDMTGGYRLAFLICVILVALAVTLSFFLLRSKSYQDILVGE